ncbi:MAG: hypothetical protein R8J85_09140 [Mariprofundales bacterium]
MRAAVGLLMPLALIACSQQPDTTKSPTPKLTDPAAIALHTHCSACHAPPSGNRHTVAEWPQVLSRMELHRLQRGFDTIPPTDRALLLSLLQSGAKP